MTSAPVYPEDAVDPTKLIVNYLPVQYTDEDLKKLFEAYGPVEDANVVMDRQTGLSRGYGFVKFATEDAAKKALEALNGKALEERTLHVDVSRPRPAEVNLFVGGLAPTVRPEDLAAAFAPFGAVVDCRVPPDAAGACRGYGFVRMGSRGAARAATAALHGKDVEGLSGARPLTVKRAESNGPRNGPRNGAFRHVPVGMPVPVPVPMAVPVAPAAAPAPAAAAPAATGAAAPAPAAQPEGVCVFIYNIPHTMDELGLRELFAKYGSVVRAQVMRNLSRVQGTYGASRGFGFVNMSTVEEANNAIADLNGRPLIPDKPLQVSLKTNKQ